MDNRSSEIIRNLKRELGDLKFNHANFLHKILDVFNTDPDDTSETEQINEVERLINEKGVRL